LIGWQILKDAISLSRMEANQIMAQSNELSKREKEVAELLLQGKSNKQIALALGISEHTVEFHLKNIYKKRGVGSRAEAIIELGKSMGTSIVKLGETIVDIVEENTDNEITNKNRPILQRHGRSVMTLKISLQEISRFLVTYKIPIFIWLLIFLTAVIAWILVRPSKPAWTYEREGEYPDESTVGMVLQRSDASDQMVYGQFGTVAAWPAKPGYVKYNNIETPQADHLYFKLRYSKHSSSTVLILIYLDNELSPRTTIMPVDQGSWDKFVWTDVIDLESVVRGIHSIKFYTDGQEYGVADLDKFILTIEPP
jgi:DNA-binding CsgD family transcriptional regulator